MFKTQHAAGGSTGGDNVSPKQNLRAAAAKHRQSNSPQTRRRDPLPLKPGVKGRRCASLPPSELQHTKKSYDQGEFEQRVSAPESIVTNKTSSNCLHQEKDITLPHCVLTKTMRALSTKKRDFLKSKKILLSQQNSLLDQYAVLKDLEARAGIADEGLADMRVLTIKGWPAHDLLLLIRDDLQMPTNSEISGVFGPQVLQQIQAQLNPIPEEVMGLGAELMARREELLHLLRYRHRNDRATYVTNLEWKAKTMELDNESENLHRIVAGIVENLKAKITYSLDLAKTPWLDRDTIVKKLDRLQKENATLQHKIEEISKQEREVCKDSGHKLQATQKYQAIVEELSKERAAKESLKEVINGAESMLRIARAKITNLEKQLKELRAELELAHRKHKDLEQLYRHRETSYDARSRKLLEVSKTGEITIETLSRQRDALELRVKELREQAEEAEQAAAAREAEMKQRTEILQAKVAAQEKYESKAQQKILELEIQNKHLEEQLSNLRERSQRLADLERQHCLQFVPAKESEPTDRETELWKELQMMRMALNQAEEELRQSRADKDGFLNSLAKIAQDEGADKENKLATELLNREKKIVKMQAIIEDLQENDKIMEQTMGEYENQLAALRLEVKRVRNYDCYTKEMPYQDLQTELLAMQLQVETLSRERSALANAAASRALMLERHERAAHLFARMTRARRELVAQLEGQSEPPPIQNSMQSEVSRSLTLVCATAAETWSALRAERTRVLRLESAVLSQSLQLEREERVRTQLERRRAILEREILRSRYASSSQSNVDNFVF